MGRQSGTKRGQDQRGGPSEGVLPGKPGPECALIQIEIQVERVVAERRDECPERQERCSERQRWNNEVLGGATQPIENGRGGNNRLACGRNSRNLGTSRRRAVHTFDQIIHLFEFRIGLAALDPGSDHGLALVVNDRTFEDDVAPGRKLCLDIIGLLARGRIDHGTVGRDLDELLLQAAAVEIRNGLARDEHFHEAGIERLPVPFRTGEVGGGSELRLVDMIAADHGAAAGGIFHHGLGAIDMAGDHVNSLIDEAVGGLGLLDRHRPVAGEDDL